MTEQELRENFIKKLTKLLYDLDINIYIQGTNKIFATFGLAKEDIEHIADRLIAAGIGDVSEYKRLKTELRSKVDYIHELWDVKEDYKHRAEVAEKDNINYGRALYNLAIKYVASANIWTITADDGKKYLAEKEICALYVINDEIKNAEKELQEGRKDD